MDALTPLPPNLILIGFSGTGKTRVGRALAERLCWQFVDLDSRIAEAAGMPIPAIFAGPGEAHFRRLEATALREACQGEHRVIATGGGAVSDPANRDLMLERGFVVCLEARPETIYRRLRQHQASPDDADFRPLLDAPDPLSRIRELKGSRQAHYAACHATVHSDLLEEEEAVEEVHRWLVRAGLAQSPGQGDTPVSVKTAAGFYHVIVEWGALDRLGELAGRRHPRSKFFLVGDERVFAAHGTAAMESLARAGKWVHHITIPAGEESKSLARTESLYDWLIRERAERGDVLVALGGGVVGDLAGYVAATYLRGIDYVQVPTTLLAMVDSSVGGKTAVNHPSGKNLIGAFHPPSLVVADVSTLATLPERELRSGWAEVVKHAMIMDAGLFATLEASAEALRRLDAAALAPVIRRNVWLKARVVSADERETGHRISLNYGHTIGHGIERASGYALNHGEAVAIGMVAAARLAVLVGCLPSEAAERQNGLLRRFGLPLAIPPGLEIEASQVREAMRRDKKASGQSIRWVLPTSIGQTQVVRDLPEHLVEQVLEGIAR